jgi:hypothetical protein
MDFVRTGNGQAFKRGGVILIEGKRKLKIIIDLSMTVMLPLLMAYELIGEAAHEYIGIALFLLFILHHILNWRWHRNLAKGRYSSVRLLGTFINSLLLVTMLSLGFSGMMMSKHTITIFSSGHGTSFARTIHLLTAYWGFTLMSFHIGLHWNMVMSAARKFNLKSSVVRTVFLRITAFSLSAYGIQAFICRQFGIYMFLRTRFVFFDFSEPVIFFIIDYLAIMFLFACIGYYAVKILRFVSAKSTERI